MACSWQRPTFECKAVFHPFTRAQNAAEHAPIPAVVMIAAPMPLWQRWLEHINDTLSLTAAIFGIWLAAVRLRAMWRDSHAERTSAASEVADAAAKAAAVAGKSGWISAAAATVSALAIVGALATKRAEAAPIPAGVTQSKPRKRITDASGGSEADPGDTPEDAPKWHLAAAKMIGTHERTKRGGPNPVVQAMFPLSGLSEKSDCRRIPWCAIFVNAMLDEAGYVGTNSAMARSFLKWGKPLDVPRVGCIVVLWRGDYDDGTYGHVGNFVREDAKYVYVLGGNQGDQVSVERFAKSRVLGYRWPRSLVTSKTTVGATVAALGSATATGVQVAAELSPVETSRAVDTIEAVKGPLQQIASVLPSGGAARYLIIGCALLSLAGALLAIHGRNAVRRQTGV